MSLLTIFSPVKKSPSKRFDARIQTTDSLIAAQEELIDVMQNNPHPTMSRSLAIHLISKRIERLNNRYDKEKTATLLNDYKKLDKDVKRLCKEMEQEVHTVERRKLRSEFKYFTALVGVMCLTLPLSYNLVKDSALEKSFQNSALVQRLVQSVQKQPSQLADKQTPRTVTPSPTVLAQVTMGNTN